MSEMPSEKAVAYMDRFEKEIIVKGFEKGIFDTKCDKIVPLREGKFVNTPFGKLIGKTFQCDDLIAIDYYGHYKLSTGIIQTVKSAEHIFPQVKCIVANIIHFNSIKMSHIKKHIDNAEMELGFSDFKRVLVGLRWGSEQTSRI